MRLSQCVLLATSAQVAEGQNQQSTGGKGAQQPHTACAGATLTPDPVPLHSLNFGCCVSPQPVLVLVLTLAVMGILLIRGQCRRTPHCMCSCFTLASNTGAFGVVRDCYFYHRNSV